LPLQVKEPVSSGQTISRGLKALGPNLDGPSCNCLFVAGNMVDKRFRYIPRQCKMGGGHSNKDELANIFAMINHRTE
jgi:hypothetical protein